MNRKSYRDVDELGVALLDRHTVALDDGRRVELTDESCPIPLGKTFLQSPFQTPPPGLWHVVRHPIERLATLLYPAGVRTCDLEPSPFALADVEPGHHDRVARAPIALHVAELALVTLRVGDEQPLGDDLAVDRDHADRRHRRRHRAGEHPEGDPPAPTRRPSAHVPDPQLSSKKSSVSNSRSRTDASSIDSIQAFRRR